MTVPSDAIVNDVASAGTVIPCNTGMGLEDFSIGLLVCPRRLGLLIAVDKGCARRLLKSPSKKDRRSHSSTGRCSIAVHN